jgi:hypothetical protein
MVDVEDLDMKTLIILFLIIAFIVIVAPWILIVLFLFLIAYVVFGRLRRKEKVF